MCTLRAHCSSRHYGCRELVLDIQLVHCQIRLQHVLEAHLAVNKLDIQYKLTTSVVSAAAVCAEPASVAGTVQCGLLPGLPMRGEGSTKEAHGCS
jgi:hypothetical protein